MTFEEFKRAVIAAAAAERIADYELYYVAEESTGVEIFGHEVNSTSLSEEGGVCFRCIQNGRMGYASTEELSADTARDLVCRAKDNASVLESEEQVFLGEGGKTYTPIHREQPVLPDPAAMTRMALAGQEMLYAADPAVVDGSQTGLSTARRRVAIVNSRGLDLENEAAAVIFFTAAMVSDGAEMNDDYRMKVGSFREEDMQPLVAEAVAGAKSKMGAGPAPTGSYPVVFAPKAVRALLATFSPVFSAENARKGLSLLKGREGEQVATSCVTLTDDPFYGESAFPMNFDAEGTPTYKKNLIENGVLLTLLHNLKSAAATGRTTTGNAAKAGYNAPVEIRPFTLYIAPGSESEEQLLARAKDGVYIDFLGGLHAGANVISGDFSLQSEGYLIENGRKTRPVRSFTVAGNFYTLLRQIAGVGNKAEFGPSGGVTAYAAPHLLVEGLSVAGE